MLHLMLLSAGLHHFSVRSDSVNAIGKMALGWKLVLRGPAWLVLNIHVCSLHDDNIIQKHA